METYDRRDTVVLSTILVSRNGRLTPSLLEAASSLWVADFLLPRDDAPKGYFRTCEGEQAITITPDADREDPEGSPP